MNLDLKYYFSVFLRRIYILLIVAFGMTATAVYVALELPPKYRAQARLLVESPQIPDTLAASTVSTGAVEQLQIIEQRLMTRENLLDIARRYNVFKNSAQMSADEIVSGMRSQSSITRSSGRGEATFMTIAFSSASATTAAEVVNEYVTRILEANRGLRTAQAEQTLDFFEQEVDRLGVELDRQSNRIILFKSENKDALPDSVTYMQGRQTSLQERLAQVNRELVSLAERRERVLEAFEAGGSLAGEEEELSPEAQQLADLRKQLDSALAIFSPQNPRVRLLEARVEQMEQRVLASNEQNAQTAEGGEEAADPRETMLNMQLAEISAQEEYLQNQKEFIEAELESIQTSLSRAPEVAIAIDGLERDYQNIQQQYNAAVNRLSVAATGERIELMSKGQRIAVIEQATTPDEPSSPNRPLIAGGGAVLGIGLGAAAIVLLEFLNQSIRRPVDLEKRLGITPVATVPYIRTRREVIWKRLVILLMIVVVVVGGPSILYAIHTFYLPLDLLVERTMDRIMP